MGELAKAYGYSWEPSRSGVVLFRKDFADQLARPEVPRTEFLAATREVLGIVGREKALFGPPPSYKLLEETAAALPPDVAGQLDREGVLISSLPPALRKQAVQAAYSRAFGFLSFRWSMLEAWLEELPSATLGKERERKRPLPGGPFLELVCPQPKSDFTRHAASISPHLIVLSDPPRGEGAPMPVAGASSPARKLDTPLLQAYSVAEAAQVLGRQLWAEVIPAPELLERRLVLLVQKKDARKGAAALAELHGWTLTQSERDGKEVLRLRRPRVRAPEQPGDVGTALREALPTDVYRFLTARMLTIDGKPVLEFKNPVPIPGYDDRPRPAGFGKLQVQIERVREELQQSLAGRDLSTPIPFTKLDEEQRRLVVYWLFSTIKDSLTDFYKALYDVPGYVKDPLNSRIIRRGDAIGIQSPDGGAFLVRKAVPRQ